MAHVEAEKRTVSVKLFPDQLGDNVHSHLRHAKRPMAVRGGWGFEQWPFSVNEVGFLF